MSVQNGIAYRYTCTTLCRTYIFRRNDKGAFESEVAVVLSGSAVPLAGSQVAVAALAASAGPNRELSCSHTTVRSS